MLEKPLTPHEIRKTARATVQVLSDHGLRSCLFGSAASNQYGMNHRVANDVDVVVLTRMDPEEIKQLIVSDSRFFLKRSRDPNATYTVLYFSLPPRNKVRRSCKVDILVPGVIHIPWMPLGRISSNEQFPEIPLVPFMALLLLKLIGWAERGRSPKMHLRKKVPSDEKDVNELLVLAIKYGVHLSKEQWLPKKFIRLAQGHVKRFKRKFPSEAWEDIGL